MMVLLYLSFPPKSSPQVRLRFDPTGLNRGCRTRDHVVNLTSAASGMSPFSLGTASSSTSGNGSGSGSGAAAAAAAAAAAEDGASGEEESGGASAAATAAVAEMEKPAEYRVYEDLLAHRDVICIQVLTLQTLFNHAYSTDP